MIRVVVESRRGGRQAGSQGGRTEGGEVGRRSLFGRQFQPSISSDQSRLPRPFCSLINGLSSLCTLKDPIVEGHAFLQTSLAYLNGRLGCARQRAGPKIHLYAIARALEPGDPSINMSCILLLAYVAVSTLHKAVSPVRSLQLQKEGII